MLNGIESSNYEWKYLSNAQFMNQSTVFLQIFEDSLMNSKHKTFKSVDYWIKIFEFIKKV